MENLAAMMSMNGGSEAVNGDGDLRYAADTDDHGVRNGIVAGRGGRGFGRRGRRGGILGFA